MSNSIPNVDAFSQLVHFSRYSFGKQKMSLEKGMLIVSTDIDVGSSELGVINKGKRDKDVNDYVSEFQIGKIEELAVPLILKLFDDFRVPMTLGVRGQLTEVDSKVMKALLESPIRHDVGAHGYYHRSFSDLTAEEAENELRLISAGMKKYSLIPRSFIYPRNKVAHLNLLKKYNYTCYRSLGNWLKDRMCIEKEGSLYNIHPSVFTGPDSSIVLLKGMLNIAIRNKLPFHMWFHFWNFGEDEKSISKSIKNLLIPFLSYAKRKQEQGLLAFETMHSAAHKVEINSFS